MGGARHAGARRIVSATLFVACSSAVVACSLVLGLDSGKVRDDTDASLDALAPDVTTSESSSTDAPGPDVSTGLGAPDASGTGDGAADARLDGAVGANGGDACTPDPNWCDTHCGSGPDNCGETRGCSMYCAPGNACGDANTCLCVAESTWCNGRCGSTLDNCGNAIDCGACDAGADAACVPESSGNACGSRQCGQVTNNCQQLVNCGPSDLSQCAMASQVCQSDGGCCTPDNADACGNHCGAYPAVNACGQAIQCPQSCGAGVCYQEACCTPMDVCGSACGVDRTDNCGQTVHCACTGSAECSQTHACCTPSGCGGNCLDSCGVPKAQCCIEAGAPDASADGEGPDAAGSPDTGSPDAATGTTPDGGTADAAASPDTGAGSQDAGQADEEWDGAATGDAGSTE